MYRSYFQFLETDDECFEYYMYPQARIMEHLCIGAAGGSALENLRRQSCESDTRDQGFIRPKSAFDFRKCSAR